MDRYLNIRYIEITEYDATTKKSKIDEKSYKKRE